ncbi:twin-arginine translocase TatA/TatE family subunit [Tautonia sociabilis]|uniref:Twin-arginine translocase TatA/TatE family subunit n=1 Tax=Tautonia sociabilis TaxID=2080755 RepID=A0A432MQ36_9BACT|nr:twin-arginine translocase TatA/TatE family subunit [Tautonia sociabilis]
MLPGIGPQEMVIIGILGVLLFGKRLPEVGRSLGKGIAEFRRSISGVEDELRSINRQVTSTANSATRPYTPANAAPAVTNDLSPDPAVPKFEPPTAAPSPRGETASDFDPQPYYD